MVVLMIVGVVVVVMFAVPAVVVGREGTGRTPGMVWRG